MSLGTAPVGGREDALYREMKVSQGGVMLLVRLFADLQIQRPAVLRRMLDIAAVPSPEEVLPAGSRLSETFAWLQKRFGKTNAVRAVQETAREILEPISS